MTSNQIQIQYLLKKLRYKYRGDSAKNNALNQIVWFSLPAVYPEWNAEAHEMTKAMENRKQAKKRTKRYLQGMYDSYNSLFFVTLTFNDECLKGTNEKTRHSYVSRFLNANFRDYYANVDYGTQNEREHYHAVVSDEITKQARIEWSRYGNVNFKRMRGSRNDVNRVGTYMRKLTNHANKLSTGKSFHKRGLKDVDELPF